MTAEVLRNYIGGEWIAAETSNLLPVHNPATEELIAQVPLCGAAEMDAAVQSAQTAYESWRKVPVAERARYLFELNTESTWGMGGKLAVAFAEREGRGGGGLYSRGCIG